MKSLFARVVSISRNPFAINSAVMFAGTMAVNFGAYLYHLVVGRILGPEKYGEFSAMFSLLFVISVPATVLQLVITKFFAEYKAKNDSQDAKGFFLYVLKILSIAGGIGGIVYALFIPFLENFLHIPRFDSFLYLYFIFLSTFVLAIVTGVLNGYQLFVSSSGLAIINMILRFASGLFLAPFGVALTLFGMVVSNILSIILYLLPIRFLLKVKAKYSNIPKMEAVQYMIPTFLGTLGMTLLFNFDVVLVKHFFPAQIAGIYGALSIFGKIIFFASSAVGIVMYPMIAERKTKGTAYDHLVFMGLVVVAVISLVIVVLYFSFSSLVSVLLFGRQFAQVAPYLGFYGLFIAGVTISNYLFAVSLASGRVRVWTFILIAAISQAVGIAMFHGSINEVLLVNSVISWALSLVLLIYYRYDHSESKASVHHRPGL